MWRAPHRHRPESFARLRERVIAAFRMVGAGPEEAEQSWYVFGPGVTQWLGATPGDLDLGVQAPRFDLYLDTLLRGLPVRTPPEHPCP